MQTLFFFLFKVKYVIYLYMKNGKNKKTIIQWPNIFLNLDVKKYFYCLKIYEKKNSWTTLNFIYFEGINVFLLWKKKT